MAHIQNAGIQCLQMRRMMIKLRVTITYEYDADPEHYGTDVPEEMAAIDMWNYREYPQETFESLIENNEFTVTIEPVEC